MKKNIFVAAFAAVAILTSCTEKPVGPERGDEATIKISLENPSATRAIDEAEIDADAAINNLIVFVTRGGEAANEVFDVSPKYFSETELDALFVDEEDGGPGYEPLEMVATTKAKKVYIVTNTGPIADGPFAGVTNMADVRAVAAKIDGSEGGNKVEPGNVWMSGEGELEDVTEDDDVRMQYEAEVQLYYIPAKVFVITKNSMKNYVNGKTVLQGVTITNAGAWTGFIMKNPTATFSATVRPDFSTGNYDKPFYYNGQAIDAAPFDTDEYPYNSEGHRGEYLDEPAETGNHTVKEEYSNTTNFEFIQQANGASTKDGESEDDEWELNDEDAFYIFPALTPNKVWASVYGTYTAEDAEPAQRFWNAAFGGLDSSTTKLTELKSGNKYILTLELAGNGDIDGGEDDPTIETVPADLKITVLQAEWNVIPDAYKRFE